MTGCGAMLPADPSSRRLWLLVAKLLLVAAAVLTLIILVVIRTTDTSESGGDACRRHKEARVVLPPAPQSDREIIANLADHLMPPRGKPCQRELVLGGEPFAYPGAKMGLVGCKYVCLDPGLSLARADCLVVASRPAMDASFDEAAALFGCEVHSYGPDRGRELDPALSSLPGGRRPISLLALQLDAAEMETLLRQPPAALSRVEQLTVRLNLTAALAGGRPGEGDVPLLKRLYAGLLRLQDAGFHPFSSAELETDDVVEVTLAGQKEAITSQQEISWMKVLCDG